MGQSFVSKDGEEMIVIIRGTMLPTGWSYDADLIPTPDDYSSPSSSTTFPGLVSRGNFRIAKIMFKDLENELSKHPNLKRISFGGHSLGCGLSTDLTALIASRYPGRYTLSLVGFGCPIEGDKDFSTFVNTNAEIRRINYVGSGSRDDGGAFKYGIGDMVPSTPAPGQPFCKNEKYVISDGFPDRSPLPYSMPNGNVNFYAPDLPGTNKDGWLDMENFIIGTKYGQAEGGMACHICAYDCWVSGGSIPAGPLDKCYFPGMPEGGASPCDAKKGTEATLLTRYSSVNKYTRHGEPVAQEEIDTMLKTVELFDN